MADVRYSLAHRTGLTLVLLRVRMKDAERTAYALNLPTKPLHWQGVEPRALWLGPEKWLLVSDLGVAGELIATIDDALSNLLYATSDISDALECFQLAGPGARSVLAMGCGLDLDSREFTVGTCARTRFAKVPMVIAVTGEDQFDLYIDRSYSHYLQRWIAMASLDPMTRA